MHWRDDADPARASSADLLLFSMISNLRESRNYAKDAEGLRQSELYLDPVPRPVYIAQGGEKIGFTRRYEIEIRNRNGLALQEFRGWITEG